MPRLKLAGLNVRLLLLVLLAMLPALGLLLYNAAAERQRAAAFVHDDTERLAHLTAAQVSQVIEGQRQLLVALARLAPIAAQDARGCAEVLGTLVGQYPFYSSLSAAAPDGTVFCSTVAFTGTVSVADRTWFQRAVATGGFALGDYQQGRFTGADIIVGAYPAYDASGALRAVVSASLNLTRLDQILADAQLPLGAAVNITDHNGTLLSRYPDPAAWVGQRLGDGPIIDYMLSGMEGTTELPELDGETRLYAFEPVEVDGGGQLHVAVGIPTDVAFAQVDQALGLNLLAMAVATVLALAATRAAAETLVLRRVRGLLGLTQRLAAGDLRARSGGPYGPGELEGLAQAFDQMAASLETRESQRRRAVRSLEMLSTCNQALVRATDEPGLLDEICRGIVEVGGYRLAWIGFEDDGPADGAAPRLRVAAQAGDEADAAGRRYLDALDLTLHEGGPHRSPAEVALRTGKALISVHRHAEAKAAPWQAQALARGCHASMALPIVVEDRPVGALSVYAAEANAFDADAARLLHELAGDVAFGLRALRVRAAREEAEAQVQQLNTQLEARVRERTAELEKTAVQLEAANAELQAFSYSVSHDLRAPLRSIDGFSLALVEDYGSQFDDDARDYLGRIRAAAQRMGDLIDALLVLSRVTRAELRRVPLDLSALAEAVAGELRQREPEREVALSVAPGLTAEGDPSLVRTVLENLLGNAWKFTAGCRHARIEFGRLPNDAAEGSRAFFIRDNGAGFDMTYAGRLFGAFQRLHDQREFKGTGVGLATVHRIIVRHGGRVWAQAEVGGGATFYFTLP